MNATATKTRERKLDPSIIRVGDTVRILRDFPVERVGYPKAVKDYYEAVEQLSGPDLDQLFAKYFSIKRVGGRTDGMRRLFLHNLAYLLAKKDGFGGGERQLFMGESVDKVGRLGIVESIRTVKTGEYFGPSFCHNSYEWEAGGLAKEQTHKLCTVAVAGWDYEPSESGFIRNASELGWYNGPYEFLATDLEKLVEPP